MSNLNPKNLLGGAIGWFEDEDNFEKESSTSSIMESVGEVLQDASRAVQEGISGAVTEVPKAFVDAFKDEEESKLDPTKFPTKGSIEFNKNKARAEAEEKKKKETQTNKIFYDALKDNQLRTQQAKDKMLFEEEINDISTNLST